MIFKDKKFSSFFWTQFWGSFNDNFFKNALVVLVAFRGIQLLGLDSATLVAVSSGLFILPFFLFSPLAGQLSDKFEKSKIIRMTKLSEIIIMVIAGLGFLTQSYLLLLAVLFLMGTQSTFFGPVKYSLIPDLLPEEDLTEGNAFIELGTFLAILLGTILGGIVTTLSNTDIIIGSALVLIAVLGYLISRKIQAVPIAAPHLEIRMNPFPEFIALFKILNEKKVLINSVLGISWFWFFGAGILSVLPIYVKNYLWADEQVVTLFLSMFTLGIGMGSILCEKLSFKRVELGLVPIGSIGMTLLLLDLFFTLPSWPTGNGPLISLHLFLDQPQGWRLMLDFFMMSVFGGVFIVPLYTLLQERSHTETRSRVIAANNILNALFMVFSSLLVMLFYQLELNTAQIFLVFSILNAIVAIYIYSIVPEFTLRFYSWVLSHIMYKVKIVGLDNIPKTGACILAPNHVTFIDWIIIAGACKRPARFVMYYKFFTIPIVRILFKHAKVIPIAGAKEDSEIMKNAFQKIQQELANNEVVCIFPEGKLTGDGKLSPLKPGIKKIVELNSVPVVPVVIKGLWRSIFSRASQKDPIKRRSIEIEFLPILQPETFTLVNLEQQIASRLTNESTYIK
ncbi:MAG: MFS transporter [Bdellovibrionales bacterium]|nr:MFS transporter [Bdellovibrionales bacterium]